MKWRDFLQPDILSLCVTYGLVRYTVNTLISIASMYAVSLFHWSVDSLSWMHIISGASAYFIIIIIIRLKIVRGIRRTYFAYLWASIFVVFAFVDLMLPKLIEIKDYYAQIAYFITPIFLKCWIYFFATSSGKVLLFNTVTPENACVIDGVRSTVGAVMRLAAYGGSFLFFTYAEWFTLPLGLIQLIAIYVLMFRMNTHFHNAYKKIE